MALIVASFVVTACGSDGDEPASPASSTTVVTFGGIPGVVQSRACTEDAQRLQQVSDLYVASHGKPAPSIRTFVDEGFIDEAPSGTHGYVIEYDGATGRVTATGACTIP